MGIEKNGNRWLKLNQLYCNLFILLTFPIIKVKMHYLFGRRRIYDYDDAIYDLIAF